MEQFKMVLGHSAFRSDPIGILHEHLSNTVKIQQKESAKQ